MYCIDARRYYAHYISLCTLNRFESLVVSIFVPSQPTAIYRKSMTLLAGASSSHNRSPHMINAKPYESFQTQNTHARSVDCLVNFFLMCELTPSGQR